MDYIIGFLNFLGLFFKETWWLWLPLVLFFIVFERWLLIIRIKYASSLKWILLELKFPSDIEKSLKAMEQVLAGFHGIFPGGLTFQDKYFKGKSLPYFLLEIVAHEGQLHYFLRTEEQYKNLVEAKIYAQYPGAEIAVSDDYVKKFPLVIPSKDYDLWGTDMTLAQKDSKGTCYPIRTYTFFEGKTEEERIDPINHFAELADKVGKNEYLGIQIFITPISDNWKASCKALIDEIYGKEKKSEPHFLEEVLEYLGNLVKAIFSPPQWGKPKEAALPPRPLSPYDEMLIRAIMAKMAKIGFETSMRWIYVTKQNEIQRALTSGAFGFFKLFNEQNLNQIVIDKNTLTFAKFPFAKRKLFIKKRHLYFSYTNRFKPASKAILNIEELATIFHPPTILVEAPTLRSVMAKKGSPPPELPVMF